MALSIFFILGVKNQFLTISLKRAADVLKQLEFKGTRRLRKRNKESGFGSEFPDPIRTVPSRFESGFAGEMWYNYTVKINVKEDVTLSGGPVMRSGFWSAKSFVSYNRKKE
jgi:hypothetical protein